MLGLRIQIRLIFPVFWETENAQIWSFELRTRPSFSFEIFPVFSFPTSPYISLFSPIILNAVIFLFIIAVTRSWSCCRHNFKVWRGGHDIHLNSPPAKAAHCFLFVVIMLDYALISRFIPRLRRLREPRLSELLVTIATPEFTCIHPPPFSSCNTSFTFPPPTLPPPSVPSLHFHCTSASRDFLKAMLPLPTVPLEFRACNTCPRLCTSCILAGYYNALASLRPILEIKWEFY